MPQKEGKIIDLKPNSEGVYEPAGTFTPKPVQQQTYPSPHNKLFKGVPIHKARVFTKVIGPQYRRQANEFVQGLEAGLNVLDLLFRKLK